MYRPISISILLLRLIWKNKVINTDKILKDLNDEQRKQLHQRLQVIAAKAAPVFKKNPEKFARVTQVLELQGKISLQVTVSFHQGDKGTVHPVIEGITV